MFGWSQEIVDSGSYGGRANAATCPNPVVDP